jgi:DNA end-binding protein Ku
MAQRANWKGFLKLGELSCAVALYTAVSQSERIVLHTVNRATGHRINRQFVDSETEDPVERDDQVKGYEVERGEYVMFEPEEVAALVPESDKLLALEHFIPCGAVDAVYFDRPYYLAPADAAAAEAFALIRDGMKQQKVAALARTVLFRRLRTLLLRAHDKGLIATALNFDYEIEPADEAFAGLATPKIGREMLDLAKHIIVTKRGKFDPAAFEDRYEAALTALVKAKLEGKALPKPKPRPKAKTGDLLEALRRSAAEAGTPRKAPRRKAS